MAPLITASYDQRVKVLLHSIGIQLKKGYQFNSLPGCPVQINQEGLGTVFLFGIMAHVLDQQ